MLPLCQYEKFLELSPLKQYKNINQSRPTMKQINYNLYNYIDQLSLTQILAQSVNAKPQVPPSVYYQYSSPRTVLLNTISSPHRFIAHVKTGRYIKKANDLKNSQHTNSKKIKNWLNVTDFTLFKLVETVKKYPSRGDNNFIKVKKN